MTKPREALFMVSIGDIGVGKTEQNLLTALRNVQRGEKSLLADVQNEFGEYTLQSIAKPTTVRIKKINIRDIPIFVRQQIPECRRVVFLNDDGTPMTPDEMAEAIIEMLRYYKDGLIVAEDLNAAVGDYMPKDLISRIISQRHFSCDILTSFQSIARLKNPKIWSRVAVIRFHKCFDSVEPYRQEFGGHYELMKIAETLVNMEWDRGNRRFFCYIYRSDRKIRGIFSKEQFIAAIDKYIAKNYQRVLREFLEERDSRGKKVYESEAAYRQVRQQLYDTYYGNAE